MPIDLKTLAIRIKRLTMNKKKQKELADDIKNLNPGQIDALSTLLDDHDEECIQLLNAKIKDQQAVREKLSEGMGVQAPPISVDPKEFKKLFDDLVASKESFAIFLAVATDEIVAALEEIVVTAADKSKKKKMQKFFRDVRSHKHSVDNRVKEAGRQAMIKEIEKHEKMMDELDEVLKEAEKDITYIV